MKTKKKIPKDVANTLHYALEILAADYRAHDSDTANVKDIEKNVLKEIKRAQNWLDKFQISGR